MTTVKKASKKTTKTAYVCEACGADYPKWSGQCGACGVWNQMQAVRGVADEVSDTTRLGYAGRSVSELTPLSKLYHADQQQHIDMDSGLGELNRVLGGGLMCGSVVLIGGEPGVGKSTLLLQAVGHVAKQHRVMYVTGEEALTQVANRAKRLNLADSVEAAGADAEHPCGSGVGTNLPLTSSQSKIGNPIASIKQGDIALLGETRVNRIMQLIEAYKPRVVVIDSVQTLYHEGLRASPGSISQVRESCGLLVQMAKQTQTTLLLVGHVTKEGALAGPRVLEHMVDTVLYFEGQVDARFRMVRAVKNRFGAINELAVFIMTDRGLREIDNPSALFLSHLKQPKVGSVVLATWEGSRPLLVEVQALVDQSHLDQPRRVVVGLESNRMAMLLAILNRHAGVSSYRYDIFVNVVGGLRVTEPAADLAILLAIVSGLNNKPWPMDLVVFGELGLSGEVRPVAHGQERLREAIKQHYKHAIIPHMNRPNVNKGGHDNITIHPLKELSALFNDVIPTLQVA